MDASNNVFVTGYTYSSNFPTPNGSDTSFNGGSIDVFVSQFTNGLGTLTASTFLGGDGNDYGQGIAVYGTNTVFVTGYTGSSTTKLPTTIGAYDELHNGGNDVFVSKFTNNLATLTASTFLGGSDNDSGFAIAVDSDGNVFVTGDTRDSTTDLPTHNGAYGTHNGGVNDVFVSKFTNNLATLSASTFLGGSGYDYGYGIAVDASNNVFVTGYTSSSDLPTTGGAYGTYSGGYDAFVSKFTNGLGTLSASTFLGGSDEDRGQGIAVYGTNTVFVTGYTGSQDLPTTAGAYNISRTGAYDAFVSKFTNGLGTLTASTFLGGSSNDYGYGIAVDSSNNIFVTGYTISSNLPTTTGAHDESHNGGADVFVSKFSNNLATLSESTYLGGGNSDDGRAIAVDASNNVFVTGYTYDDTTVDLPTTTGAYNQTHNGFNDVFVSKFGAATYIELISFTGKAKNGGTITLTWETAAEIDNAGFNVYRARGKKGEYQRLNNALIPAKGSPMEGAVYEYTDTPVRPGVYYYQLEDIDRSGASAMHGPVRVTARMGRRR